jgi:hypothetical protein
VGSFEILTPSVVVLYPSLVFCPNLFAPIRTVYNQFMQQFPTIRLAIPTRAPAPFDSSDWIFELKHDGFRALAYIADGRCQLVSRKNNPYKSFGRLREALAGL